VLLKQILYKVTKQKKTTFYQVDRKIAEKHKNIVILSKQDEAAKVNIFLQQKSIIRCCFFGQSAFGQIFSPLEGKKREREIVDNKLVHLSLPVMGGKWQVSTPGMVESGRYWRQKKCRPLWSIYLNKFYAVLRYFTPRYVGM
jgi:hypothetical protein